MEDEAGMKAWKRSWINLPAPIAPIFCITPTPSRRPRARFDELRANKSHPRKTHEAGRSIKDLELGGLLPAQC